MALCAVATSCGGSHVLPRVSVPLECKPSRECARKMAEERARAEARYEHSPARYVDVVSQLAEIGIRTGRGDDDFDPLLVIVRDNLDDLPEKDREKFTGWLATLEDRAGRYDDAEKLIRHIPDTHARDEAWSDQGLTLARAGRIDQAIRETRRISDDKARTEALDILLSGLARDGRPDLLRQVVQGLGAAVEANGFVTRQVALAEATGGNDAEARRLAETLNGGGRIYVQGEIAESQLQLEKPEQALITLRELHATVAQAGNPNPLRGEVGLNVIQVFSAAGAAGEALDLVPYLPQNLQTAALLNLTQTQASAGQIDAATATAHRIPDADIRDREMALSYVDAARVVAGENPDKAFSELHDSSMRVLGECTAARLLGKRGQQDRARQLLQDAIPHASFPADPPNPYSGADLGEVVRAEADLGLFDDALATVVRIPHGRRRAWALEDIFKAQAAHGLKADAAKALILALAEAQPERGTAGSILQEAAKAGLAAEALDGARRLSDESARDTAMRDLVAPLARQGRLEDAFTAAAGLTFYSSGAFVELYEVLSEKPAG